MISKDFFALEEYFDKHADEYFGALMQVSNQSTKLEDRDITPWLEVFTKALAIELSKIKDRVRELSIDIKIKEKTWQANWLVRKTDETSRISQCSW